MITVHLRSDLYDVTVVEYANAKKWHIGDDGILHIVGATGNIGAHARDTWAYATEEDVDNRSDRFTVKFTSGETLTGTMPRGEAIRFQELAEQGHVETIVYQPAPVAPVVGGMPGVNKPVSQAVKSGTLNR